MQVFCSGSPSRQTPELTKAAIWAHFLGETPSSLSPDAPSGWLTFGFFLTWSPQSTGSEARHVTLLLFEPPPVMAQNVHALSISGDGKWERILDDPYQLVDMVFDAWCQRIDKASWEMTDRVRSIEQVSSRTDLNLGPKVSAPSF